MAVASSASYSEGRMKLLAKVCLIGMANLCAVVGIVFLMSSSAALANPILVGTATNATGINDLVIDGVTYDVTFVLH